MSAPRWSTPIPASIAREVAAFDAKITELQGVKNAMLTGAVMALGAPENANVVIEGDQFVVHAPEGPKLVTDDAS